MHRLIQGFSMALVAMLATAPAQSPDRSAALARSFGLQQEGPALRGGGDDYRVVFDAGSMEFTPALGREAPETYSLRFTLQSVRRGARAVRAGGASAPLLQGDCAVFARDGFAERYQVRADGVEQSFVFDALPEGDGDLVVVGRLDTAMTLAEQSPDALRFAAEGFGGVRIGAVTGIDAGGRRAAGALRCDGARLELVLPAAFVETAAYPLVLDPLIGTDFVVASSTSSELVPDAAYDESVGQWLVAWQRVFSSGDAEIRCQRLDIDGNPVGALIFLSAVAGYAVEPTVASVNLTNRYLVAWQQAPSVFGQYDLYCAAVNLDGTFTAAVPITTTGADEVSPRAAGEFTNVDDEALVTWWEPGRAMACQVTVPAGTGVPIVFDLTAIYVGTVGYASPRISRSGGGFGWFLIVFDLAPWTEQIAGIVVDRDLTILTNVAAIATGNGVANPDVDGDGVFFVVAYERDNGATGPDVFCQRVRFDLTTPPHLDTSFPAVALEADPGAEHDPAVGFLGHKYAVAWVDDTGLLTSQIKLAELDPVTCAACGPKSVIKGTRAYDSAPRIGTQWSNSAGATDGAILLFASAHNAPPFQSNVECQLFEEFAGGAVTSVSASCGEGGTAGASGAFAIGNPQFALTLSGGGPGFAALLVLNAPSAPIACGACTITPPLLSFNRPYAAGAASLPLPLPCDMTLVGGTIEAQWWVVGTATSPCSILPNAGFSNRLHLTVGY